MDLEAIRTARKVGPHDGVPRRKSVLRKNRSRLIWKSINPRIWLTPIARPYGDSCRYTGSCNSLREMHKVPQLALPVRHIATPPIWWRWLTC